MDTNEVLKAARQQGVKRARKGTKAGLDVRQELARTVRQIEALRREYIKAPGNFKPYRVGGVLRTVMRLEKSAPRAAYLLIGEASGDLQNASAAIAQGNIEPERVSRYFRQAIDNLLTAGRQIPEYRTRSRKATKGNLDARLANIARSIEQYMQRYRDDWPPNNLERNMRAWSALLVNWQHDYLREGLNPNFRIAQSAQDIARVFRNKQGRWNDYDWLDKYVTAVDNLAKAVGRR